MFDSLKLDTEERELLDSYERGEWQSVGILQEKLEQYQSYAVAALEANGLVSIVLPKEDLKAIRRKAAEAGMSYQMFIANIVHQFVSGRLVEKPRG
jgi:predicted DNA binding CopG/RHH family protein